MSAYRGSQPSLVVPITIIILLCIGVGGGIWLGVSRLMATRNERLAKTDPEPEAEKKDSPSKRRESKNTTTPPKQTPTTPSKRLQEPAFPPSFEDDWQAAVDKSIELERGEPKVTAEALKLLTAQERQRAETIMADKDPSLFAVATSVKGTPVAVELNNYGLRDYSGMMSARFAREDPQFKSIMKTFWKYFPDGQRVTALVDAMRIWASIALLERSFLFGAVENDLKPINMSAGPRDTALLLGGKGWLAR